MEKLMNSTRPEARDSLGFARQSSWPEVPFDVVWSEDSLFTLFAHQKIGRARMRTDTQTACLKTEVRDAASRIDDFDAQIQDASGELTTR
jgi:hypothetical protein